MTVHRDRVGHRLQNERVKVNKLYSFLLFVSDVLGFYIYIMIKGLLRKKKGDLIVVKYYCRQRH